MIISNFREYLDCLRNLFINDNADGVDAYWQDMQQSGKKLREHKEILKKEIAIVTAKINFLRQEMKQEADRRKISEQIKKLKENKILLLKKMKQITQTTRFAMLSDESKASLCTFKILRKYLTRELMENQFSGMKRDENGDLIFDAKVFEDSFLYQDARHIFDYVSAYIMQNPGKVLSESYFNKFFDKESGWRGIVNHADKFFDNQSKRKKSRAEIIAESKSDIDIVREYPNSNVILVRLKTPEALDYEGTAAHNCVGGGGYDKLLNKTQSGIYSLRRLTKDGELKPVVTIEYNDGIVKQIHGPCNGIVGFDYTMAARDAVLRLMNLDSIQDLVADERFAENRLNCLGLYRNGNGGYFDIMTINENVDFVIPKLIVEAGSIKDYDFEKLKIKDVVIEGKLTSADAKYISKFRHATKIAIKALGEDCHIDLQGFDELEKLEIDAKSHLCTIITGKGEYETMVYSGDRLPLVGGDGKISHLKLHLREAQKIALSDLPKVKELSLFAKPETFIKADSCQPMIDTLHMEEVSIDSLTTKEFPKLQHLEITGNFEGDLRLPLLKTLQWNYFSNENHEFDLSLFPQIEEFTFVGGKHWTDNTTKLKFRGIHPNLKKLHISNVIAEDIDFGCFPKLENVSIAANNDYEINLSAQQEIQYMSIRGTSIFHTCTLKGKKGKIKKLDIEGNIRIKSEIEDTPQIKQVAFHDMELNDGLFCDLGAEQTTFDGCLITTEIAKKYITGSKIHLVANFGNRIKDEIADFSDSKIINARGILNLDVKKLILPEKVDYFDFSYKVSPETEIIGRCSPNTLIVHEDNRLLDYINYEDVKETSCYTDKVKELLPLMTSLKYLQSYPVPAEMLPDSVETWHIHDSLPNLFFIDINTVTIQEPDKRENELSFWNAKNVKNFSIHSFISRTTNIDFPQNMEECKIEGQSGLEEIDFSKYKKLKKLTISVVDEKLRKIKLPASIEELKADKSTDGVGIIYGGPKEPMPVEWEIPETANPEVIKYLQNQYGNDNVRLLKEQKTQAMLPMLVWQQKFLGGTIKS